MKILFYRKIFNRNYSIFDRLRIADIPELLPEGVEVYFGGEREDLNKVDVVIFDLPFLRGEYMEIKKPANQIWVGWLLESLRVYPWIPAVYDKFDLIMSYRMDSDIPIPYFCSDFLTGLRTSPVEKSKGLCSFVGSSVNLSNRLQYLEELWKYMAIDSFGWRKNTEIPDRNYRTKQEVSRHYHFTIAFENSISDDFVTEKFFDPMLVGSLPIYLGAGNIEKFAPADHCYLNARDYSPKELAGYLTELENNPREYASWFAWKEKPFRPAFVEMLESVREHFMLRLIRKINE